METMAAVKRQEQELSDDLISHLPDAILHLILSSFPLKSIAQLGILSKRWSYIWRSYPNLDFSELKSNSWDFVQDVLWRRCSHSNVKVFRLTNGPATIPWLNRCILHVVNHCVEDLELELDLTDIDEIELPRRLLTSGTLKSLKLHFDFVHWKKNKNKKSTDICPFKVRAHALHLVSLTSLSLQNVAFPPSSRFPRNKNDVFSNTRFPNLRLLHLKYCRGFVDLEVYCSGLEDLCLDGLELKSLRVFGTKLDKIEVSATCMRDYNVGGNWVKISAPNVGHLSLHCDSVCERFSVDRMMNLRLLQFFGPRSGLNAGRLKSVVDLLSVVVASSRDICLDIFANKIFADIELAGNVLSTCVNLKKLVLCSRLNKEDTLGTVRLLKNTPFLQSLVIYACPSFIFVDNRWNSYMLDAANMSEEEYWESQVENLKAFLNKVEIIKIDVICSVEEKAVNLAKFLLKHGVMLKELKLVCRISSVGASMWEQKIGSQLEGFGKASPNVKISMA